MKTNPATGRKILSMKPKAKPLEPAKSVRQIEIEAAAKSKKAAREWLRSFEVIREYKPLKIGIHKDVVKNRPEGVSYKAIKIALSLHVLSKKYQRQVKGKEAEVVRYDLDGNICRGVKDTSQDE